MFTPRDVLRRLSGSAGMFLGGPCGSMTGTALRSTHVVTRCEVFLSQNGGESSVRQLMAQCRSEGVGTTLTEVARVVRTGSMNTQSSGEVQAR